MNENKFVKGLVFGAIAGAGFSLFDKATRHDMKYKLQTVSSDVKYYAKNREDLKMMLQEKAETVQSVYNQFTQDAQYLSGKYKEIKTLTPQVKTLVTDTKEAFANSKEEYKTLVKDDDQDNFTMPVLPEHVYVENQNHLS